MRQVNLFLILIFSVIPGFIKPEKAAWFFFQQAGGMGVIAWPVTGEQIRGAVVVRGSTPLDGLQYYEVDYALSSDPDQAWVLIQEGTAPVQDGILAVWDTSLLPDGTYNLRLFVRQTNGDQSVTNMYNLLVNNSVPTELTRPTATAWYMELMENTSTPAPMPLQAQVTPALLLSPAPTQLPANPVEISSYRALGAFGKGALVTLVIFIFAGGYFSIRNWLTRR